MMKARVRLALLLFGGTLIGLSLFLLAVDEKSGGGGGAGDGGTTQIKVYHSGRL